MSYGLPSYLFLSSYPIPADVQWNFHGTVLGPCELPVCICLRTAAPKIQAVDMQVMRPL